ncbi:serine O-acetyltransferase [Salinarimonas soli]|uniref:Serine acetyltransferase n=1 Tax=Salinarimonas soli TaxID=1638099 RepID=A0A5B2V3I4_9HYPH|nr:serine acetyltransferase [Salinarimonas soli]KAA2233446.1 serine acetyltransferase [Salinarimonas soli]
MPVENAPSEQIPSDHVAVAGKPEPVHHGLGFWAIVKEDLKLQYGEWSTPGFQALLMYRIGVERYSRGKIARKILGLIYNVMHRFVRNVYTIELYSTAKIGRRVKIAHQGGIVIHPNAVIGDDCVIRQNVTIGAVGDDSWQIAPTLGRNVSIGAGAVVIGRIHVGDNVRIGPNSVVTMNVPADSLVVVPPPRILPMAKPTAPAR